MQKVSVSSQIIGEAKKYFATVFEEKLRLPSAHAQTER
jgi:hypothetical protein